jgi:hypothetical protein
MLPSSICSAGIGDISGPELTFDWEKCHLTLGEKFQREAMGKETKDHMHFFEDDFERGI